MSDVEPRSLYDFRVPERRPQKRALTESFRPAGREALAKLEARVAELERRFAELERAAGSPQ